jgi:hypothetical protein
MKEYENGGARGMHGTENEYKLWSKNPKERNHLEEPGVDRGQH